MAKWIRNSLLSLVLVWPLFASEICLNVIRRVNPHGFRVGINDHVKLTLEDGKTEEATFLGERTFLSQPVLYFFSQKTGEIFRLKKDRISIKEDPDYRASKDSSFQKLPEIRCQQGGSCAAHGTFNAMKFMDELDFLLPALRKQKIIPDDFAIWNRIEKSEINAEHRERIPSAYDWLGRPLLPSQPRFEADMFREHGLRVTETKSPSAFKAHLKKGLPAVIGLCVQEGEPQFENPVDATKDGPQAVYQKPFKPDPNRQYFPRHAVVAVGLVESKTHGDRILILDSAKGYFFLWDYNDTVSAMMKPEFEGRNSLKDLLPKSWRMQENMLLVSPSQ